MVNIGDLLQEEIRSRRDQHDRTRDDNSLANKSGRPGDLFHYVSSFLDLSSLGSMGGASKLFYCRFNSEQIQRKLCSKLMSQYLNIPSVHFQHSAFCLIRRLNSHLLTQSKDLMTKSFNFGSKKQKRKRNLHTLTLSPYCFPHHNQAVDGNGATMPVNFGQSSSSRLTAANTGVDSPFTILTKDPQDHGIMARLSCIAYFEVRFTETGKKSQCSEEYLSIGITNQVKMMQSSFESPKEKMSIVYNHVGSVFKSTQCCANNPYYKFTVNDIVGCGIMYPPLAMNNRGVVFFTRNGELIHLEESFSWDMHSLEWYPMALYGNNHESHLNFGITEPFLFNIHVFESLKARQVGLSDFHFYEEYFFKQSHYQRFSFPLHQLLASVVDVKNLEVNGTDNIIAELVEIHNPATVAAQGLESEMDFKSEEDFDAESEENTIIPIQGQLSSDHSFSALPLQGILSKPSSKWMGNPFSFSLKSTIEENRKSTASLDVAFDSSTKRRDSKHDLDEDSMIVELSSVDSMAMNEMRDCELNSIKEQDHSENQFRTPLYLGHVEKRFVQVRSVGSAGSLFSSSGKEDGKLSASSCSPGETTNTKKKYAALSDAGLASTWLQKATEEANIRSKEQASKMGGEIVNANLILDGYDSDRSVATSLFVEVASVDENGSYKAYGAACEEDVFEENEEYIRGRLVKSNDTGLQYDSDESEETCGARWDHNSHDGSDQAGRKHKRRRSTSFSQSSSLSAKRTRLKPADDNGSNIVPNNSSISYLAATACITSVTFDGEDGYDGASELRSFDGDFIDDHTTDNEVNNTETFNHQHQSGAHVRYDVRCSPGQDSLNQSRTTASFPSSATTSVNSGSPEEACYSDQAISSPRPIKQRYGQNKKRNLN